MPIAPLPAEHLRWRVPDGILTFRTTEDVPPSEAFVGQENALAALRRGVELLSPGFNVFVSGLPSTGRLGAVERIVRGFSPRRRASADLVYVSNFLDPARPRLLTLPAGRGVPFRRELVRVASLLLEEMPRVLQGGEARRKREACRHAADATNHAALQRLRQRAETLGFVIGDAGDDEEIEPEVFWVEPVEGTGAEEEGEAPVHSRAELQVLGEAGEIALPRPLAELLADYDSLSQELAEAQEAGRRVALAAAREMARIDAEAIAAATAPVFAELSRQWRSARAWIAELHEAIVDNVEWFHGDDHEQFIAAFSVNVVHVGTRARKAPIVIVSNPTWQNLLGGIESGERGADHRSVRAGALVDADGGFLIVSANELLQEPATWKMLKRGLSFGEMDVQNPGDGAGGPAPVVRPDPLRLDVKVILVGDADTYALLFYGDPDFAKLFKIKAEFEPDAPIQPDLLRGCVGFLARVAHREKLLSSGPCATPVGAAASARTSGAWRTSCAKRASRPAPPMRRSSRARTSRLRAWCAAVATISRSDAPWSSSRRMSFAWTWPARAWGR